MIMLDIHDHRSCCVAGRRMCVIDSDAYKFVIGTVVLDAMDVVLYVKRKWLELVGNDGRVFCLPLFTKAEVK